MGKIFKNRIIWGSISILLFLFLLLSIVYISYKKNQESPLYTAISERDRSKTELELPDGIVYDENSGEQIFVEAINLFLQQDYEKARGYFFSALDSKYYDPALPAYAYYFIDQCDYELNQTPDKEIIFKALEEISKYPPLSDNTVMLWDLFSSYDSLFETSQELLILMEDYRDNARNLDLYTWA
ncbi:MAG: hypothetical protein IKW28_02795, partial [Lachnospiraceae bacterium]|nr:hypothetical protein [Lachnospiraceae bacterium]